MSNAPQHVIYLINNGSEAFEKTQEVEAFDEEEYFCDDLYISQQDRMPFKLVPFSV